VGARCLQARVGSFSSVGGCCICGWASHWGSFSLVGGCCVHGRLRSGVGVALGVVLIGGGLLRSRAIAFVGGGCSRQWGLLRPWALAFEGECCLRGPSRRWGVVMGGFRRPGGFLFSSSGCRPWAVILCGWGTVVGCGVVLAHSGCDVALPRRC
jgi:hypothetical protein